MKDARFYDIEGLGKLPSVTTVLGAISKPALYRWYEKQGAKKVFDVLQSVKAMSPLIHDEICKSFPADFFLSGSDKLEAAAQTGTSAHNYFERWLKGERWKLEDVPEHSRNSAKAFLDSVVQEDFEVIKSECQVYHPKFLYAGTLDAVLRYPHGLVLADWKTASGLYPEMDLQVVAYAKAVEELTHEPIEECKIMRFDKTGKPFDPVKDIKIIPKSEFSRLFGVFLNAFAVWKWQTGWQGPEKP